MVALTCSWLSIPSNNIVLHFRSFCCLCKMGSKKGVKRGKYKTKSIQPNGKVQCDICDAKFEKKSSLLQHFKSTHLKKRTGCPFCRKKFISTSTLNRHKKKIHGVSTKSDLTTSKVEDSRQPSFESHELFPCMANTMSLKKNKHFGVHVVADTEIDVGQPMVSASPFACIEYLECTGKGCFQCDKTAKIKCAHCIDLWFCSSFCKANILHQNTCDTRFVNSDNREVRLISSMSIVAINTFKDLGTVLEFSRAVIFTNRKSSSCRRPYSEYAELLQLQGQAEPEHAAMSRRVVQFIMETQQLESFDRSKCEELKRMLFYLAYNHANSLNLNSFAEKIDCSPGGSLVRYYIFDVLSRFNHSCDPNIELYLDDNDQ